MDPSAWNIFIDAAELGSLSKVAMTHGTSQPQISRLICDLEHACGGRLFQRTGRGVVLTEFGERIAPKIRTWLASTEQLANDIRATAGTPIGKVRIGSLPSTAHPLLTTVFMRLKEKYPFVQLSVREGQGAQLDTWLEEGSVDLAILFRMTQVPRNGRASATASCDCADAMLGARKAPRSAAASVKARAWRRIFFIDTCPPF